MDNNTLEGLKIAFQAAPSEQLAKVICYSLIELERVNEVAEYLPDTLKVVSEQELIQLGEALLDGEYFEILDEMLNAEVLPHKIPLAKVLKSRGRAEQALMIYKLALDAEPTLESAELNQLFAVDPKLEKTDDNKRPKLKVVEKLDMGTLTDLSRYREATTDFSDVVGLEHIKKQIHKKIILPFQKPSLFQKFKKKIGGGVILYGPPGCGKTLLARATAGECNAAFFNVEISDVLDMYIGESEQKLHAIFEKARSNTPCVLFFDEIEALAGKREHSRSSSTANIVSQFLTELDGFTQNNQGVLVLASTNVPWAVDAAFLRPGRFDRMFFVPPPDKLARKAILEHHVKDRPSSDNIDYLSLASKAVGYSGADLHNLVEMAADEAIDESLDLETDVAISNKHFKVAIKEARATTTEWLTTARNYARYANDGGRYDEVLAFLKKHGK
jgi:SpoVK/Ycf46/Vps4 family AAA+-type ATPase